MQTKAPKLILVLALAGTTQQARARSPQCRRRLFLLGHTCPSLGTTRSTVRPQRPAAHFDAYFVPIL